MVSRRSSSAVKRRSVVARQDDTSKARKLRLIADPNGITVPAKIVRVKKGRKKEKAHKFHIDDCSMELDEADSAHYVPISVGSSVRSSERILELPKNVSLSTMSDAHHFGIHGGEIVSAGGDIHINKYSPPNAESSVNRVPTTSSLPLVSESEIWMPRNAAQGANGAITDLQFPNVIQTLSSYLKGIRRHLIPSRTTVDDIMHSPIFLVDFPTAMIPEDTQTYSRFMLQFRQGYPLYRSTPIRGVSETHWKKGIRIGDVGRVRPDGSFEFLFNINPNEADTRLPDGFEKLHHVDSFQEPDYYSRGEHLLKGSVDQISNSPITYKFSASGAILQLPEGAIHFEAQNKNDFSTLASRYAQRWYEYMNVDRSMGAPNGSLYLITGCIKCTSCATAVVSEPHVGENWLEFYHEGLLERPRYMWKRMGSMTTRVNQNQEDLGVIDVEEPRHSVFIRGFKITLGDKQWNQLIKIAVAQHSSQDRFVETSSSSGTSWSANQPAKDGSDTSSQYPSSDSVSDNNEDTESSAIIQQLSSSASPTHPSDFINAILLQRHPEAKVAVTHDDDWLGLFPEGHSVDPFSLPVDAFLKILDEACSTVDEHGCVSLVTYEPVSSAAMEEEDHYYLGDVVRELIKIEDDQKDVVGASLPPNMSKEETERPALLQAVQDLPAMIPSVFRSRSLLPTTPQHFGQDQHEAGPVKLKTKSILPMNRDFGPGYDTDTLSRALVSADRKPSVLSGGANWDLDSPIAAGWPKRSESSAAKDYGLQEDSITYSASHLLSPQTADGSKSQQLYSEQVVPSVKDDPFLSPPLGSPLARPPRRLLDMVDNEDLDLSSSHSSDESDNDQAGEDEDLAYTASSSKLEAETPRRKGPRIASAKELARIQRRRALEWKKEQKRLMATLKARVPPAPATKPKISGRNSTIRAPPTRTTWECGPDNTTCHHCRRRTYRLKMICNCGRSWCNACILTKYENQPFDVNMRDWACPCCQNACRCDVCTKKRGETYISKRNCGPLSKITTQDAKNVRAKTKRNHLLSSEEEEDLGLENDTNEETEEWDECSVDEPTAPALRTSKHHELAAGISRRKKRVFIGRIQPCWGQDMVHKSKVRRLQEGSEDDIVKRLIRDDGEKRKKPRFKKRIYIGNPKVFLELGMKDKYNDSITHDMIVTATMDSVASSVLNVVNTKLESGWSLTDIKQELIESKFFQSSMIRTGQ